GLSDANLELLRDDVVIGRVARLRGVQTGAKRHRDASGCLVFGLHRRTGQRKCQNRNGDRQCSQSFHLRAPFVCSPRVTELLLLGKEEDHYTTSASRQINSENCEATTRLSTH